MLIHDLREIGNRLLAIRKKAGMTQMEVAEAAGLADRTYADIERGSVNMRMETLLKICDTLHITPDEILTKENTQASLRREEMMEKLKTCPPEAQDTALRLMNVYLQSIR